MEHDAGKSFPRPLPVSILRRHVFTQTLKQLGEATHSIGSSRDLPGQCETRTESEVGRAAQQIRGLQAVDLPVPTGQKKVWRGFYVRCAS